MNEMLGLQDSSSPTEREVGWECLAGFYVPVSALLLVNVFFYWTAQRTMARQMLYNRYILLNSPILLHIYPGVSNLVNNKLRSDVNFRKFS